MSATSDPKVDIAKKYVAAVFAVDIKSLDAAEDETMKGGMTKEAVDGLVTKMQAVSGKLQSTGTVRTGKIQAYDVVYIPCTFEHNALDAKVVFDSSQKVAGFFFVAPGGI